MTGIDGDLDVRDYYRRQYERTAPSEQRWTEATATPELVGLVTGGRLTPGARVLEVGCGVGTETVYLASAGYRLSGIDISAHAIARAEKLAEVYGLTDRIDWHVGDVLELPFADGAYDAVVDRGCFHCFEPHERARFAAEIARVLRPSGLYVLRCLASQRFGAPEPLPCNEFVERFGVTSDELFATFSPQFACQHLELGSNTPDNENVPFGWLGLWYRR